MEETKEIWKPISGFNKYLVSNKGKIKSLWFGKELLLKTTISRCGYISVGLNGKESKTFLVHRIVAKEFLGFALPMPNEQLQLI